MTRTLAIHAVMICAAGCAGDSVATVAQPAIATNAIATNAIATNAIATNAIATNAIATNAIATNAIATNGILTGGVADPEIQLALHDPGARVFMRYLVGCALEPKQAVTWTSSNGTPSETYTGLLGLCPEWHESPPDAACRERVSSCILARNNAFGISVAFSMRGQVAPNTPLELGDHVPPHDHIPQSPKPVRSLLPCRKPATGEFRDCGWQRAAVGICEPGTPVAIAAGNYAACGYDWLGVGGSVDEMLRVCDGTSACDWSRAIASVNDACSSQHPQIDFTCPASGLYSVMTGAYDSRDVPDGQIESTWHDPSLCHATVCEASATCCYSWDASCDALAETACRYPASEAQVFRWVEGSFYGNIFGAANLNPAKPQVRVDPDPANGFAVQSGILQVSGEVQWIADGGQLSHDYIGVSFSNMFACSSPNWTEDYAYFQTRVCAGPDPNPNPDPTKPPKYTRDCAATYVGRCQARCLYRDALPITGDHDAGDCNAGEETPRWAWPMTTVLSQPCDALPHPALCGTVLPTPIFGW